MFVLPGRHGEQPDVLDLERHFGVVGSVSLLPLVWYKQLCWLWQQGGEPFSRGMVASKQEWALDVKSFWWPELETFCQVP